MGLRAALRGIAGRWTLTRQVALLSLVPMVVLGLVLARALQTRIVARTLADQGEAAQLIARIGIQPRLTPHDLKDGLTPAGVKTLDEQLRTSWVKRHLARIKIWNAEDTVVYSDDHSLIGRRLKPSDDLENALDGHPDPASVVVPRLHTETAGEVGLGTLVEVYVPLRLAGQQRPAGAFEMYLSYRPIAGAIRDDKRMIALIVAIGLIALWLLLYSIVAKASRRLRQQAQENYRLAHYDRLTGLPNRMLFAERLGRQLRSRRRHAAAVLMLDIDGFKQINSTLGSATGDELLRAVAGRLRSELGQEILIARLGNDEFAVLRPVRDAGADGLEVARCLHRSFEMPMSLSGIALNVEVSVGVTLLTEGSASAEELLEQAEAALSRARASGSRTELYSPEADRFDPHQLILLGQVRRALERDELTLHYQPKLDLASGQVTGVEALVRWQHPERGLLSPMEFVPLIEPTALVGPVTMHVVERAVDELLAWRQRGLSLEMSVNLSARNLIDPELPAKIFEILASHGIEPSQLTVEVTESATMIDPEKAIDALRSLREGGVGVSIDDFGTGNASIAYLAQLPASEVKIDKSFITDICEDSRIEAIVRSTVDIARHLDLRIVAEGIETEAVLERVAALGCDVAQGYLISRPIPGLQLLELLAPETEKVQP
ncbi:MAG TPA: bifunctional diguanylate cyclase/phosphodiesterase [Solirubrobacteraceae bacterium]|jgi:diguanylate cyclase (GGDEF)-like protein